MWRLAVITVLTTVSDSVEIKRIPVVAVTGVRGEEVALPCEVSGTPHDDLYLLLWFREPLTTPIYRLDERSEEETQWSDERVLGQRASLDLRSSPAVLRVTSLTWADQGLYTCRVDYRLQPTRTTRVNLTVVAPPEGVSIMAGVPNASQAGHISLGGPYLLGDVLSFTCVAHGGTPRPSVVWYRGAHLLDALMESDLLQEGADQVSEAPGPTALPLGDTTKVMPYGGEPFNTLHLQPLRRDHLLQEFKCEASNTNLTLPASSILTLDMNLPPLSVAIQTPDDQLLRAGREYLAVCLVVGARPAATITWWSGHQRVLQATVLTSEDQNVTASSVVFTPRPQDNGSFLRCIAETFAFPATLEDTWNLTVLYVPRAQCGYGASLDADNIKEGDDVYFECSLDANPPATRISWQHNNMALTQNVSGGVIMSNQTLVLQKVGRWRAGLYSCHAHNDVGVGVSSPLSLDVKYAPVCSLGQVTTYAVERYEDAQVTCSVEANPAQKSFQWTFNNTADTIEVPQGRYTSSSSHSVITYTPMTLLDYGTLLCWAANEIGIQREPCVFHIVPAGKPESPGNCTVEGLTRTSIRVRCEAGGSGGLPQHFLLQATSLLHHHQGGLHRLNLTALSTPDFTVDGLQEGGKYRLVITAVNDKGASSGTRLTIISAGPDDPLYQLHDGPLEAEVRDGGQTATVNKDLSTDGTSPRWWTSTIGPPSLILGALALVSGLVLLAILGLLFVTIHSRRVVVVVETAATTTPRQLLPLSETLMHAGAVVGVRAAVTSAEYCSSGSFVVSPGGVVLHQQAERGSEGDPDLLPLQQTPFRREVIDPGTEAATILPPEEYHYSPVQTCLQPYTTHHLLPTTHHLPQV
ncbi:nephrin [Procambarus clarkii]|uniref:nephrin n=1 Tax=Procambarus clarkii TaxID=6728 RepID=UPI003743884D